MAKIELNEVKGGYNLSQINSNFDKIEEHLNDRVLYRDTEVGEPNQMKVDLDMNGYRIYNLLKPILDHEPARWKDIKDSFGSDYNTFLRVSDGLVQSLPGAAARANKLLSFDSQGQPQVQFPSADSATQLRIDLQTPTGTDPVVGFNTYNQLRSYEGPATKTKILSFGFFGEFSVDDSDTLSEDDGGTVIVDMLARRWKRNFTGFAQADWFGVTRDEDSTQSLQLALNYLNTGLGLELPEGNLYFSNPLQIPTSDSISLIGKGLRETTLIYTGPSTVVDLITYGDGTRVMRDSHIRNFSIDSTTTMTLGAALRVRRVYGGSNITNIGCGTSDVNRKLWDGIHFDAINVCTYDGFRTMVQNDAILVHGRAGTDEGSDLWLDHGFILGGNNPIHCAGGFGGLYVGQVLVYGGQGNSVLIDETRVSRSNREVFLSDDCILDGANSTLIYVNNPSGILILDCNAFLSGPGFFTPTPGDCINVQSMPNGRLVIGSGTIKSAKRHGIVIQDPSTIVTISNRTMVTDCTGYGMLSTTPTSNIFNQGVFKFNQGGNVHQNVLDYIEQPIVAFATSGTLGSYSGTLRYYTESNKITVHVDLVVNDLGTAAGAIGFYLPKDMLQSFTGTGLNVNSGKSLFVRGDVGNLSSATLQQYDGAFPLTVGSNLRSQFTYFAKGA